MNVCLYCDEPLEAGDSIPCDAEDELIPMMHRECHLRVILGSLAHIQQRCGCDVPGSIEGDDPGISLRAAARQAVEAWEARNNQVHHVARNASEEEERCAQSSPQS